MLGPRVRDAGDALRDGATGSRVPEWLCGGRQLAVDREGDVDLLQSPWYEGEGQVEMTCVWDEITFLVLLENAC